MITLYKKLHEYGISLKSEPMSRIEANFLFTYQGQGQILRSYYNFTRITSEKAEALLLDDLDTFITMYDLKPVNNMLEPVPKDMSELKPL